MMDCAGYQRWFSPYVDQLLAPEDRAQLEGHLKGCPGCRHELESLQGMLRTLRTMDQPEAPDLLPGIHRQLQRAPWWRSVTERFAAPWPASLPLHGLALATTALLVVMVINRPGVARRDFYVGQERLQFATSSFDHREAAESKPEARGVDTALVNARGAEPQRMVMLGDELIGGAAIKENDQAVSVSRQLAKEVPALAGETFDAHLSGVVTSAGFADAVSNRAAPVVSRSGSTLSASAPLEETPASPEPTALLLSPDQTLLQVQWRVGDVAAATQAVSQWVSARSGFAVATNDHHLSIKLPASDVPEFLAQFSSEPSASQTFTPPLWVTISLELVSTQ